MENAHPAGFQCGGFASSHGSSSCARFGAEGLCLRFDRKYPTLILPGSGRTVRFKTLGKMSTPRKPSKTASSIPSLLTGLGKEQPQPTASFSFLGTQPRRLSALRHSIFPTYRWGALPKEAPVYKLCCAGGYPQAGSADRAGGIHLSEQKSRTAQLTTLRQKTEDEIVVLIKQRQKLYRYEPGSQQIGTGTEQLKKLRHTAKLCRNIKPTH